jgi:hypothetical protein
MSPTSARSSSVFLSTDTADAPGWGDRLSGVPRTSGCSRTVEPAVTETLSR